MNWNALEILVAIAEDDASQVVEATPELVMQAIHGEQEVRQLALEAMPALAAAQPEAVMPHIHDLVQLLGDGTPAENQLLIRTLKELLRSESIAEQPVGTRWVSIRKLWRTDSWRRELRRQQHVPGNASAEEASTIARLPGKPNQVQVVDRVTQSVATIETDSNVHPTPQASKQPLPVDIAYEITASKIQVESREPITVYTGDGTVIHSIAENERQVLDPSGEYVVAINDRIRRYAAFDSSASIEREDGVCTISLDPDTTVSLEFRSPHDQPAGVITTPADPQEMMVAVSRLASALKTTSCERSFPTLRGHPPLIELGDELSIPDSINRPQNGVLIRVPSTYEHLFTVAPLAFYLGAGVVPGEKPVLETATGFVYPLETEDCGFEQRVVNTLKQVFLLDCVSRTEGFYPVELAERRALQSVVEEKLEQWYNQPLYQRLESMLSIPYELIESVVPTWPMETTVEAKAENIEIIPHLVEQLSLVRTVPDSSAAASEISSTSTAPQEALVRGQRNATDSQSESHAETTSDTRYVEVPESGEDVATRGWVGDGIPVEADKVNVSGYRNRLDTSEDSPHFDVQVVCNDREMVSERRVVDAYRDRGIPEFDLHIHDNISSTELKAVFEEEADFVHYIGHITEDGLLCPDGHFDPSTLSEAKPRGVLLNGCNSYEQGLELVDAGVEGAIVTTSDVVNSMAVRIGKNVSSLLESGFSLSDAIELATRGVPGGRYGYTALGNTSLTLADEQSSQLIIDIYPTEDDDRYEVEIETRSSESSGLGAIYRLFVPDTGMHHLSPGEITSVELLEDDLRELLAYDSGATFIEGEFVSDAPAALGI